MIISASQVWCREYSCVLEPEESHSLGCTLLCRSDWSLVDSVQRYATDTGSGGSHPYWVSLTICYLLRKLPTCILSVPYVNLHQSFYLLSGCCKLLSQRHSFWKIVLLTFYPQWWAKQNHMTVSRYPVRKPLTHLRWIYSSYLLLHSCDDRVHNCNTS